MKIELEEKVIKAIAREIVSLLRESPERLLTTRQVSEILGISQSRVYQIKEFLPYVKSGNSPQSPIRFKEKGLMDAYLAIK